MKRSAPPDVTSDHPPLTRTRSNGEGIGSYTLTFAGEGNSIIFDQTISAKSNLLLNLDPDTPVPMQDQFHISSAHALIAIVTNTTTEFPALAPELFAMTVSLCDFLQMDQDVVTIFLKELEPPSSSEDPLSRLRACHQTLPIFPCMLFNYCDIFQTEEETQQAVESLLSTACDELTYYQLSFCDGKFLSFTKHLALHRFAKRERERRQQFRDAATAKTKALRMVLKNDRSDDALENTFRDTLWKGSSTSTSSTSTSSGGFSTEVLSKELLDEEMWKAIQQGRVDVAQRLLELGAEPALYGDEECQLNSSYQEINDDKHFQNGVEPDEIFGVELSLVTSLTLTNDLTMLRWLHDVAGVDINLCTHSHNQQAGEAQNIGKFGGFNSMWKSSHNLDFFLSRGCNPNQAIELYQGFSDGSGYLKFSKLKKKLLIHKMKKHNGGAASGVSKFLEASNLQLREDCKLLIRHGADPNCFLMTDHPSSYDRDCQCGLAYWPLVLGWSGTDQRSSKNIQSQNEIDMKWCEELLAKHGANPNWPIGIDPVDHKWGEGSYMGREWDHRAYEVPVGLTILLRAILDDNLALIHLLLKYNANPNQFEKPGTINQNVQQDEEDEEYPNRSYQDDGVDKLLCYYHRPSCEHPSGLFEKGKLQCPLSMALKKGNKEIIQLLKLNGATADTPIDADQYFLLNPLCAVVASKFELLSAEIKNDKTFMMVAVQQNWRALECVSAELKNDKDIVKAAMTQDWTALRYASVELKNDKEIVKAAVKIAVALDYTALRDYAFARFKNDREIVLVAVKQNGHALKYASDELKNDKEIVMVAVSNDGSALSYASAALKNDKEIVSVAFSNGCR